MSTDLDIAASLAGLLVFIVLVCSLFAWVSFFNQPKTLTGVSLSALKMGWVNFGIFICFLMISVVFTQAIAGKLIHSFNKPAYTEQEGTTPCSSEDTSDLTPTEESEAIALPAMTPWVAVWAVLSLQIPMIVTFYVLRGCYPEILGGPLNERSVPIRQAFVQGIPYFIRYSSVIWLGGLAWVGLLNGLQKFGIIREYPPQELVKILSSGGDPVAIILIVIFAIVLAPFVEETIFRGVIYRFFKGHFHLRVAQIISGALFALLHGNMMSFMPLLIIGVLLADIYEKERTLLVPMIFHAYWNGFSLLILFLTSQHEMPFGCILP